MIHSVSEWKHENEAGSRQQPKLENSSAGMKG